MKRDIIGEKRMREKISLDQNWRFFNEDLQPQNNTYSWGGAKSGAFSKGATAIHLDDQNWREVDLPHDYVLEGNYVKQREDFEYKNEIPAMETIDSRLVAHGSLLGSVAWYRKKFDINKEDYGKRIYLYFGGIYRDSTIYLNEFFVGRHESGFTSFYYDVTDFVNYDGNNVLAIRVDSRGHELWAYEGGGIYRHVDLIKVEPLHIKPWGVFVTSGYSMDTEGKLTAKINLQTSVLNRYSNSCSIEVISTILNAENNNVAELYSKTNISDWDETTTLQEVELENPVLWSIDNPYLYKAISTIRYNGVETDTKETIFGIRNIRFEAEKGFFLNDRPLKIKGVCNHQNHAGVGIAMTDRIEAYRLEKLRELGCNAYRCSHYPPSEQLLDACDRLGILVMDENRILSSSNENVEQLKSLVLRDRNHPSIVIWAIGNEEGRLQQSKEGGMISRTLRNVVRKLDPTRPVTAGIVFWDGVNKFDDVTSVLDMSKELDVMGFNYHEHLWEKYHTIMPNQPTIASETYAGMWTRGCTETNAGTCEFFGLDSTHERYHEAERQWKMVAENDWLSGLFIWTAFDYRGETTPFSWPATSTQFGIMDTCGFPKDIYYYFKAWWSKEDVLHIFPHWNMPGKVGQPVTVYCYSNCDEIELFLNGSSQGRLVMERNWYLKWEGVVYEPGVLSAKGYRNGKLICKTQVETTGAPHRIELIPDRTTITADKSDVSILTVKVVDEMRRVVPTADHNITFTIIGDGQILGVGNGNPASHESDKAGIRRVFKGLAQLIVQSTQKPASITIKASSEALIGAEITIQSTL